MTRSHLQRLEHFSGSSVESIVSSTVIATLDQAIRCIDSVDILYYSRLVIRCSLIVVVFRPMTCTYIQQPYPIHVPCGLHGAHPSTSTFSTPERPFPSFSIKVFRLQVGKLTGQMTCGSRIARADPCFLGD